MDAPIIVNARWEAEQAEMSARVRNEIHERISPFVSPYFIHNQSFKLLTQKIQMMPAPPAYIPSTSCSSSPPGTAAGFITSGSPPQTGYLATAEAAPRRASDISISSLSTISVPRSLPSSLPDHQQTMFVFDSIDGPQVYRLSRDV